MKAFDTDIFTEILSGNAAILQRAAIVPTAEQAVPIIVIEEIVRGRLASIRRSEAGKGNLSIERSYELFKLTVEKFQGLQLLSYTSQAESVFQQWRQQKLRLPTHDLRIAAICVVHSATLISRNRRDFENVPGLALEFWN
jgi:tRNA(fMet)-specific endonuclease VapC